MKLRQLGNPTKEVKVHQHARDTLAAILKLPVDTSLIEYCETRRFDRDRWLLTAFNKWNETTRTGKLKSKELGNITQAEVYHDILDSKLLSDDEKKSALRFIVHQFPSITKLSRDEERVMRGILNQNIRGSERKEFVQVLRRVDRR